MRHLTKSLIYSKNFKLIIIIFKNKIFEKVFYILLGIKDIGMRNFIFLVFVLFFLSITNTVASSTNEDERVAILTTLRLPVREYIGVKKEDSVIFLKKAFVRESDEEILKNNYGKVYILDNYHSGELEVKLYEENLSRPFTRIIVVDEFDLLRASRIRDILNISGQSYESACAFRDKIRMKQIVQSAGFKTPSFAPLISPIDIILFKEKVGYPFIIKPSRDSGSRGIDIINNDDELKLFMFNLSETYLIENQFILEEFINGSLYHVDGLVVDGEVQFSWPSRYINSGLDMVKSNALFGWYLLEAQNPLTNELNDFSENILNILSTPENTAFHLEAFVDVNSEIYLCEVASRVGGSGIREDWIESFNIDLMADFIRLQSSIYEKPQIRQTEFSPSIISGWVFIPKILGELESLPEEPDFEWINTYFVDVKPGELTGNPKSMLDTLCRAQVLAESEKHFLEYVEIFKEWAERNFIFKNEV